MGAAARRYYYKDYDEKKAMTYFMECCKHLYYTSRKRKKRFEETVPFKSVAEKMIKYAHGDSSGELDINKGICICGPTGTRKTFMMHAIKLYMNYDNMKIMIDGKDYSLKHLIFDANHIVSEYVESGLLSVYQYLVCSCLCIDDLFAEPKNPAHYGNHDHPIEMIISKRAENNLLTHFTTNKGLSTIDKAKKAICETYGDRVWSRFRMAIGDNFIELNDKDFREI